MTGVTEPDSRSGASSSRSSWRSRAVTPHTRWPRTTTATARPAAAGNRRATTRRHVRRRRARSSPRRERAPEQRQRPVAGGVDDDVVARAVAVDLVPGVVDDVLGTDGTHQLDLRGAADAGHDSPVRLGKLDGERATPPAAPVISTRCPAWTRASRMLCNAVTAEMGVAAACTKVRLAGLGVSRCCRGHRVLGERAALAGAVHLVAGAQAGDPGADRRHHTGDGPTEHRHLGPAQPDREPHGHRSAGHQDPHARVDAGGPHLDQHVVGADRGPVDVAEFERRRPGRTGHG